MIKLNRRQMISGGAAATTVAALAGAWGLYRTPERLAGDLLLASLPGLKIDASDLQQFRQDFMQSYWLTRSEGLVFRGISAAVGLLGVGGVSWIPGVRGQLDHMRRAVVTVFLSNSDFLLLDDPVAETVSYWGTDKNRACNNPFARFN